MEMIYMYEKFQKKQARKKKDFDSITIYYNTDRKLLNSD